MYETARVEPRIERSQSGVTYTDKPSLPRATFDGAQFTTDWYMNHLLQGNVKMCNIGSASDPITSAGAWVNTTPDIHMQIPTGRVVFPVALELNIDLTIDDTDLELVVAFSDSLDTSDSATAVTVYNMRNDLLARTGIDVGYTSTITAMDATGNKYQELWRAHGVFGATAVAAQNEEGRLDRVSFDARRDDPTACIVGPSELSVHVAKGAFTFFGTLVWIEFASNKGI